MKKREVYSVYEAIAALKNSELKGKALDRYIWARLALKRVYDEYMATSKEIADQTKPDHYDSASDEEKVILKTYWDSRFLPIIKKLDDEEVDVKLRVLSFEECKALCGKNDLQGVTQDIIFTWFCKEEQPDECEDEPVDETGK